MLLPPLAEQHRLAARLREQLAAVADARTALQAQLAATAALPAAHLREIFESEETQDWQVQTLGEISETIDYGFTASADHSLKSPKFLRITDIQDGRVDWTLVPGCQIKDSEVSANRLHHGDIVFARTGATTGKSLLLVSPPPAVFASYLIRTRLRDHAAPEFVSLYLQSDNYWDQIKLSARGGAQPGCNASQLAQVKVPLPPLRRQRVLAAELEARFAEIATLRIALEARLAAVERLPAALLREVFGG